jgi:hypothetical protein
LRLTLKKTSCQIRHSAECVGKILCFTNGLFQFIRIACLAATLLLLIAIPFFEFLPIVEKARSTLPEEIYSGKSTCGCQCILDSRPWYGRFNYWLWLSVFLSPALIFNLGQKIHWGRKLLIGFLAMETTHLGIVLAVYLFMSIQSAPFIGADLAISDKVNYCPTVDGFPLAMILLGWIPAFLYVGYWWLLRWLMLKGMQISGGRKA